MVKVRSMDAFKLLEAEHHQIEQQLGEFIAGYDEMSNPRRLERAKLIFSEITKHFEHQQALFRSVSKAKEADRSFVEECFRDRKDIIDAMDNLLMSHVDDDDFSQGLRALLARFDAHLKQYADKLYVQFRQQLSVQELRAMDSQASEWALGSP